ncbi:Protein-tyrosine kinase [Candidatus Methylomirabilis lanthanidiphila]|uniref:Protein-tyrosine kinase n=1 Tax=Candidatus Methylomirabilis lanthanidiphila TaxID=2211376 RepID=A0A564ZIY1_9BACT|nr:hypothetical protein [Candidatus Methylomirabilis lanthanidiphila]VUZ84847.1 Protein-tyrosine kinase [Candidatus Methylomirabilis lanthanidiphila]
METSELFHPERTQDHRDLELFRKRTPDHGAPEPCRTILNTLFKWKRLILTCLVAVVVPVCIVTLLKDAQYQATTKILLKASRPQIALSPGGLERNVNWPITPAVLKTEMQILESPDLVQKAGEASGYPLLNDGTQESTAQNGRTLASLLGRLDVNPVPDSNVMEVSFRDQDPVRATRFLNTLAGRYLEKHVAVHRGNGDAANFFTQQAALYNTRFEKAKEALAQYQGKDKIIDLNQEITLNLTTLSKFEGTLKEIQAGIEGAEKEIGILEQQVKQQPDQISTQNTVMVNPEVAFISSKLIELERQRNELLQRYTPQSRFVVEKENEIAALRKQLEGTQQHVAGDTIISRNKLRETLSEQLFLKKAALDSIKAKRSALLPEMAPYQARLSLLKSRSLDLERLQQELSSARDAYLLSTKKAEEVRMSTAMDEEKMINVVILQEAVAPVFPLPKGLLMALAMAAVSGLILGVGTAFALEFLNTTIKHEDDVERFLKVPVLATVREF